MTDSEYYERSKMQCNNGRKALNVEHVWRVERTKKDESERLSIIGSQTGWYGQCDVKNG